MERRRKTLLVTTLAGAAMLLSSCGGSVKIGNIIANPTKYQNRNVTVNGTVTNSFGAIVAGVYQVQDDTGTIYVISSGGIPTKGSRVRVAGTVQSGVTIGGRTFGTTLRQRDVDVR
jgi:hypothetical protein